MFFDDPLLLTVAVAFGGWLGWAMAGRPKVQTPAVASLVVALTAGLATWLVAGGDPATSGGQAAISLSVGAGAALVSYYLRSRRVGAPR